MEQPLIHHPIMTPGIPYQIVLGDHGDNFNNSVQYTMIQPQPVFLQQTPTTVISQPSMIINQSYQMTRAQIQPSTEVLKNDTKKIIGQIYCKFYYKLFNNIHEHIKVCFLNHNSKNYKFRK